MRHFAWTTPFALAVLVGCADTGGEADSAMADQAGMSDTATAGAMVATDLACAPTASGEDLTGRSSPYDSVTISVGEGQAKVCYSRPALRGRTMIGGEAVRYGELWRFGANEPTIIHLNVAASIAGARVEPGSYSLYAIPQQGEEWTLIVNRSTSQWGHEGRYTPEVEAQEVARVSVRAEPTGEPVESFTIRAMPDGTGLVAAWQDTRVHIPIQPAG